MGGGGDGAVPFAAWLAVPGFLIFFAVVWLGATWVIALLSGWFRLQAAFPDRGEPPIERLRFQSGSLGSPIPANFGGCLTIDACSGGLRVSVWRLFGPFSRPFFVPWSAIVTRRRSVLFGDLVELELGTPPVAKLTLREKTALRLAQSGSLRLPLA